MVVMVVVREYLTFTPQPEYIKYDFFILHLIQYANS